jgi:hypothetical protein
MRNDGAVTGMRPAGSSDPEGEVSSVPQATPADQVEVAPTTEPNRILRPWYWLRAKITRPNNVRPYLVGELVVVLCLLKLYDFVRGHAEVRKDSAFRSSADLFNLEKWLHIDVEPSINHWFVDHHPISVVASYWYQFAHITVTLSVLLWCWYWRPAAYRQFRNALVLINVVGLSIFLLLPVAPPRLLPEAHVIDADLLNGFGSHDVGPVSADAYGAFPSLHIAWAVWAAVVAFTLVKNRPLGRAWLAYPFSTLIVIVATGNHYVLDAVAGAVLALVALKVAHRR